MDGLKRALWKILDTTAWKWGPGCPSQQIALGASVTTWSGAGCRVGAQGQLPYCQRTHLLRDQFLPSSCPVGPEQLQDLPRAWGQGREGTVPRSPGDRPWGNDTTPTAAGPPPRSRRPYFSPALAEKPPATVQPIRCSCSLCPWAHMVILGRLRSHLLPAMGAQMAWDTLAVSVFRWL